MTLETFLRVLLTNAGTGAAVALLFQYAPYLSAWFSSRGYEAKRLTLLGVCLAIPLGATGAQAALGYTALSWDAAFQAAYAGAMAYAASQATHLGIRRQETARGIVR